MDEVIEKRIRLLLDDAVHKVLGVSVHEIGEDVSDRLKRMPLLDFSVDTGIPFKRAKRFFKKHYLLRLLQEHNGNVSEVALASGLRRESIHRLIKSFRIGADDFRTYREIVVQDVLTRAIKTYERSFNPKKVSELYEYTPKLSKDVVRELVRPDISFEEAEIEFERAYLKTALAENNHNVSRTAKKVGLRIETLFRKLKELGLNS